MIGQFLFGNSETTTEAIQVIDNAGSVQLDIGDFDYYMSEPAYHYRGYRRVVDTVWHTFYWSGQV